MSGIEYGNTRLRVRASMLLDEAAFRDLLRSPTLDGLLSRLATGPYGRELEEALVRYRGLRRLDEAVRTHLAVQLTDVLSFYDDDIGDRLRLYQLGFDIRNVRSLLRALSRRTGGEAILSALVPTSNLDGAALGELARQRDVRAAVDLLSVWRLPSPQVVRHLRRVLGRYTETGDVLILEGALDQAFGAMVQAEVDRAPLGDPLAEALQDEVDRINVIGVLRARDIDSTGDAAMPMIPVDGGRIPDSVWSEAIGTEDRSVILARIGGRLPRLWRRGLSAWVEHGNVAGLEADLEAARAQAAISRLRSDSLGIGVPVGFMGRKESEVKNLRLVGRAVADHLPRTDAFDQLVGLA